MDILVKQLKKEVDLKQVLLSLNYAPELTGIGKYNAEFIEYLASKGVETLVVTAPPYYPDWKCHTDYKNWWTKEQISERITVYRCPLYIPAKLTLLRRLIHLMSFSLSSAIRLLMLIRERPDVVFVIQPSLFCAPFALLYSKITGAKAVMHIQDYEIDAMFGLGMKRNERLKSILGWFESKLMKRFDVVSSISYKMLEKAANKGVLSERLHYLPNWADVNFVTPDVCGKKVREKWGYKQEDILVLYSGNLGQKQGLEIILQAAESLREHNGIRFLIIGDGANKDNLQREADNKGLHNIEFKPLQPWEEMPEVLAAASIHLVIQKKGAADSVLPSKLTNILSAGGNAIVTADSGTELSNIAKDNPGIYRVIQPESYQELAKAVVEQVNENVDKKNYVARQYAVNQLDIRPIAESYLQVVKQKQ